MSIIIAGTGTDVGKTMFSSLFMKKYAEKHQFRYWKPIQTGTTESVDLETVKTFSKLPDSFFMPTSYSFQYPASPHYAAKLENAEISLEQLQNFVEKYKTSNTIIELAGGLMVPINNHFLTLDLLAKVNIPVLLIASSGLGTINHTLLSIYTLQSKKIPIIGFFFIGKENPLMEDNASIIERFSKEKYLGNWNVPEQKINELSISEFDIDEVLINQLIQIK